MPHERLVFIYGVVEVVVTIDLGALRVQIDLPDAKRSHCLIGLTYLGNIDLMSVWLDPREYSPAVIDFGIY